jgi:hypothetical protein
MSRSVRAVSFLPLRLSVSALLLAASLAGCGGVKDPLPREAVSGTVTLDGQPLAHGVLQLLPAGQKEGTACGASIEKGKFEIERAQGPVPGEYVVIINSTEGGAGAGAPAGAPGPVDSAARPKELIPAEYNTQSKLTAVVKAGAPNTLEFALKSK